ncbi:MAG: hypothetical protein ACM3UU_02840 [Ignavibacteriales bacterium]
MSEQDRNRYDEVGQYIELDERSPQERETGSQEQPVTLEQRQFELEEELRSLDAWRNEIKEREAKGESVGDERQELSIQEREKFGKVEELAKDGVKLNISPETGGAFLKYMNELRQERTQNLQQHDIRHSGSINRAQSNENPYKSNPYRDRQEGNVNPGGSRESR